VENQDTLSGGTVSDVAVAVQLDGALQLEAAVADEVLWVERARRGDVDAFDAIMMRYETRLLRFLVGLVGDVEVARELCQDTFVAAYQALPRLHGELRLSTWLHTIALNKARSHHRRWKLRKVLPLKDDVVPGRTPDVQESTATQEAVQRALARLPKQYAEALLLQTVGGLSCREIGRVVHCSEGAVKVRLMRAREAFKRAYQQEAGDR
jgi:RNA polymerase sigma-70 factor (ECF subfamily)